MKYIMSVAVLLGLWSCAADRELRPYYFPFKDLTEGLVYEYQPIGDTLSPPFYTYYRTLYQDDKTFLTAMFYDYQYQPFQFVSERMVNSGALLERMYLYENDTLQRQTQVPVEVLANNTFPFKLSRDAPGGILLMQMRWQPPSQPGSTITLTRNRQYARDTTWTYRGETYDAIQLRTVEEIDQEIDGHLTQEYAGEEIYAEGLGLVYYIKRVSADFILEYRLTDRYPMKEFLDRAGQPLSEPPVVE